MRDRRRAGAAAWAVTTFGGVGGAPGWGVSDLFLGRFPQGELQRSRSACFRAQCIRALQSLRRRVRSICDVLFAFHKHRHALIFRSPPHPPSSLCAVRACHRACHACRCRARACGVHASADWRGRKQRRETENRQETGGKGPAAGRRPEGGEGEQSAAEQNQARMKRRESNRNETLQRQKKKKGGGKRRRKRADARKKKRVCPGERWSGIRKDHRRNKRRCTHILGETMHEHCMHIQGETMHEDTDSARALHGRAR